MPNFTPIGKVMADKTVTKQKTHSELSVPPILRMEG